MGKEKTVQQVLLGKLNIHMQNNEVESLLYTIYKINSKWIKDLNIRAKIIRLSEKK